MISTPSPPTVSVVVPIYNVERYLDQCVSSILAQTLTDIEVILVDDGATDDSPAMVDGYAAGDARVRPVHQANGGYGRAVNRGIELATGEYVAIVESDDWIEPAIYEKLVARARQTDADMVKCGFYMYDSQRPPDRRSFVWNGPNEVLDSLPEAVFSLRQAPRILLHHPSVWAGIYRADFIKRIRMAETPSASFQDLPFTIEALSRAKRIAVVHERLVHYRNEAGQGSSTQQRGERLLAMAENFDLAKQILHRCGIMGEVAEEFYYAAYVANIGAFNRIGYCFKKRYYAALRRLFADIEHEPSFRFSHFPPDGRRFVEDLLTKDFYQTVFTAKKIRRFALSARFKRDYIFLQVLGFGLSVGKCDVERAALGMLRLLPHRPLFGSDEP